MTQNIINNIKSALEIVHEIKDVLSDNGLNNYYKIQDINTILEDNFIKEEVEKNNIEYYAITSICRDNLADIGVRNSKYLSDAIMKKIVSGMQEEYDNFSHDETFIECLKKSVNNLGLERIEI